MRVWRFAVLPGTVLLVLVGCMTAASAGCSGAQSTAGSSTGESPSASATIEPFDTDTDLEQAKSYIGSQKYAEAVPLLVKVVASNPKDAEAHYLLGLAYDSTGKAADAEKSYKAALDLKPDLVEANENLGLLYIEQDAKRAEGIELLRKAVHADPTNVQFILNLARAYGLAKNVEKSSAAYEVALQAQDDVKVRFQYSAMLLENDKIKEGVEQLKLAAQKTDDAEILSDIARVFGVAKAYDQCVATFDKVIAKKPDVKRYLGRGQCKHELKDEKGAAADFQEAVKLDAKSAPAHFYLGMSYIELKKMDDAKAELKKACEVEEKSKACENATTVMKKNKW